MFVLQSQAVTSMWVRLPQVIKLRTRPNMTLAVEWDVKAQLTKSGQLRVHHCPSMVG